MDEYRVTLPEFHGPLDLLLHLVKRNEIDVRDIPVAVIAEQFRQYIDVLALLDIDTVGDFLVLAATLLEIKSRLVLPQVEKSTGENDDEPDDPRRELVRQLVEYKKYKDAASRLSGRALEAGRRLPRDPVAPAAPPTDSVAPVQSPELWDLVSAFGRLVQDASALAPDSVIADDTPQDVYREQVLVAVKSAPSIGFRDAFPPPHHRLRLIGLFLALLELIKSGQVAVVAGDGPEEIRLIAVELSNHAAQEVQPES